MTKYKIIVLVVIFIIVISIVAVFSGIDANIPDNSIYSCTLNGESDNWVVDSLKIYFDDDNKIYGNGFLISQLDEDSLRGFTDFEFSIYMVDDNYEILIYRTSASSYAPMYYIEKKSHVEFVKRNVTFDNLEKAEYRAVIRIKKQDESAVEEEIVLEKENN